jgi:hypothetical protein
VQEVSDVTVAGTCANNYTRTKTWRAVDACGNLSATVAQTIMVRDTQAPTIGSAGANGTIECTATPSFTAPTASDACGGATVRLLSDVTAAGTCANNYTRTRTWDAIDACGNTSATRTQTITVRDTQGPTIGNAGANATIECTATPSFTAPTASDACGGATVRLLSDVTAAGTCANNYTRTRTWDAIDACGNTSATRTQTITVVDTQAPAIGGQGANGTIECTATPSFTAPTASDACGGATVQEVSDVTVAGTCANNFTRTKTWRAVDACGNLSGTVAQTITVRDTQGPTIGSAGANATIECTATPSFTAPTASDACGSSTVRLLSDVTAAGSCANNYTRTRTWDAIDACGNTSATRTQTITVRDTQGPTIGNAGANATIECTATPSFTAPTASDACGSSTVRLLSDVTAAGSCANNYTRTRTWDAIDACGNTSATRTQTVTVVDTQAPTIGQAGADATVNCTTTPNFTAPTASDACGGASVQVVSDVTVAAICGNGYTRTITWKAVDACGNTSSTVRQSITVSCPCNFCTYTQGYYGNAGGKSCDGTTGGLSTSQLITQSLTNWGGTLRIGRLGHSVVMTLSPVNSVQCVIQKLPGGGSSVELAAADYNICNLPASYLKNQRINNTLLAQSITLGLNIGITSSGSLGNLELRGGDSLVTAKAAGGCGSTTPLPRICNYDSYGNLISVTNEYQYTYISPAVVNAIVAAGHPKTVGGLLQLANDALANVDGVVGSERGVSLSAIAGLVDLINNVFDECRLFMGWNIPRCPATNGQGGSQPTISNNNSLMARPINVTAYPNPFSDKVTFLINSPVSGQGSLTIYNQFGNKVQTVVTGQVYAGVNQTFEYTPPAIYKGSLFYVLRVGNKETSGKVLKLEE